MRTASLSETAEAKVTFVAASKPQNADSFDFNLPLEKITGLELPLLSRFDLVFSLSESYNDC